MGRTGVGHFLKVTSNKDALFVLNTGKDSCTLKKGDAGKKAALKVTIELLECVYFDRKECRVGGYYEQENEKKKKKKACLYEIMGRRVRSFYCLNKSNAELKNKIYDVKTKNAWVIMVKT